MPNRSSPRSSTINDNQPELQFITNKRCPFAQKAWIALEASKLPYQMREVSLYGAGGKPDWFWKLNPKGTVPVVVVNDASSSNQRQQVLADSELILEALGDGRIACNNNEAALSGRTRDEKKRVQQWRDLVSQQLIPIGKSAVLAGSMPKLRSLLREMNNLVTGPYLVGGEITLADCAAFPFVWRIDNDYGIGKSNNDGEDRLREWLDICVEAEAVKTTIPIQGWWWWW
jgi:glutathione S-transferase|eukprot:scaffold2723_cov192-Alexandrium_tamarense.AAC.7